MESSTSSCAPAPPLIEREVVAQALSLVAERSFFAFAEPAEPGAEADLASVGSPGLTAVVRFAGPRTGRMSITMPVSLTRELGQLFLGEPDIELSDSNLTDMAGEFANMVTGSWLTFDGTAEAFDLTAPVVSRVDAAPPCDVVMQINGQPVGLSWQAE